MYQLILTTFFSQGQIKDEKAEFNCDTDYLYLGLCNEKIRYLLIYNPICDLEKKCLLQSLERNVCHLHADKTDGFNYGQHFCIV